MANDKGYPSASTIVKFRGGRRDEIEILAAKYRDRIKAPNVSVQLKTQRRAARD